MCAGCELWADRPGGWFSDDSALEVCTRDALYKSTFLPFFLTVQMQRKSKSRRKGHLAVSLCATLSTLNTVTNLYLRRRLANGEGIVFVSLDVCHAVTLSGRVRVCVLPLRRISLDGEGNALCPVLSS